MWVKDFDFELPNSLIARYPAAERSGSRLLCLSKKEGNFVDFSSFKDIVSLIQPGDCLVVNHSKVIPALIFGVKTSGGKVECLIERIMGDEALAHLKASKAAKPGQSILFPEGLVLVVISKSEAGLYRVAVQGIPDLCRYLLLHGFIPLPPYMERMAEEGDKKRYQTIYSDPPGSVAAPTAGLHFDELLLQALKEKGIHIVKVTLHVGAGTFQPVRVDNILEHKMHYEWIEINQEACELIQKTKQAGHRVIAVGTTSVRVLEAVHQRYASLQSYAGETNIFIYPGFKFQIVDALITNFHLPRSTLLMLVSAFAGRENILKAYQHAIENQYRFYSYGDAMFIAE